MREHSLVMEGDGPPAPFSGPVWPGAGRQLPDTRLSTDELMATTRHDTHIDLERLTGIRERRVALPGRGHPRWRLIGCDLDGAGTRRDR